MKPESIWPPHFGQVGWVIAVIASFDTVLRNYRTSWQHRAAIDDESGRDSIRARMYGARVARICR